MPDTNHTQPTANAKIIAELFPLSSESVEAAPLELSQQQMQTLLHITLATTTHFFGPPTRYLAGVDDPRDPAKIIYPLPCLLFTGILMFLCHLAARRQIALKFRDNAPSAANFGRLFGVAQAPHGDTLNSAFTNIDPRQVQECVTRLVEILIRKKVLEQSRLFDQYYLIALDGTGIYSFAQRHCEHCLTRTHNGKTTYYHYVLEAKLVTCDGFSFSLMSEFIENPQANPTKQDCELNAFHRLAARLKQRFPRLPICLSLDGLFACGPVFLRCHDYNWRYVIVLKEDRLPSVYQEFVSLAKLEPEEKLKERILKPVEIKRNFRWVNGIQYCDSKGCDHLLNVIELRETKPKDGLSETTRFIWLTDLFINQGNVRALAQQAGRDRWKIENQGFNSQKHGGFALEHLYSHDYTSAKVFYFLLQIAHLFFQLMVAGNLFKKYFPRGFGSLKNFAERLREAWRNSLLHAQVLPWLDQLHFQIRLDTS
ncbi:MAG: transposase family protein [Pyrinomonadaceae bacterium]